MVELVIAMTVLAVGILALVAGFSSGYVALRRASTTSTASALADTQLELYRAIKYTAIALNTGLPMDGTYTSDPAYTASGGGLGATVGGCTTSADECTPTRTATGADGRSYRVDTFIRWHTPPSGRDVKLVTVVVRNTGATAEYARVQSTFDSSTGA